MARFKLGCFASLATVLAFCFACGSHESEEQSQAFSVPVEYHKLGNGLKIVLSRDETAPIVTVALYYNIGFRIEPRDRTGFAHLFEHMMFQGSTHAPKGEHSKIIESAGGISNATTNKDRTNYFETMPANLLRTVLWLEADRMRGLAVTQETLDNQREAVKEERRMRLDNQPYTPGFQHSIDSPYDSTTCFAYFHELIGSMADLDAASVGDVRQFFDTYYTPENATLTIVGDIDPPDVKTTIQQFFGDIPRSPDPPRPTCDWRVGTAARETPWEDKLANLPAAVISYPVPPHDDDDTPALDLLAVILGSGESSRLNLSMVRETQTALQTQALTLPQPFSSVFLVLAIANQGVDAPTLATQLRAALDEIATDGVTEEELTKAKNSYRASDIFGRQTTAQVAENIQHYVHFHKSLDDMYTDLDRYMAVTSDDIQRVAAKYLNVGNSNTVLIAPPGSGERPVPE
jgi:zinc protease